MLNFVVLLKNENEQTNQHFLLSESYKNEEKNKYRINFKRSIQIFQKEKGENYEYSVYQFNRETMSLKKNKVSDLFVRTSILVVSKSTHNVEFIKTGIEINFYLRKLRTLWS